ncbi:MAG: hypothetical protein V3T58_06805 [Candidatus Hydrothermarchaeales archaeon]
MELHVIFGLAGALYFAFTTYLAVRVYRRTEHSGFWFLTCMALASATLMLLSDFIGLVGFFPEPMDAFRHIIEVVVAVLFFTATYTLTKKEHKECIF